MNQNIDNKWDMKKEKPRRSIYYKAMEGAITVDESDNVFGYLAAYGNVDNERDRLHKGCAAKSILERGPNSTTARKIAYLYMHQQGIAVGKFSKLEEQDKGLYYEGTLSKVPFVQDTIKVQLAEKIINQHSIGYNYVWDKMQYDEDNDVYNWFELEIFEGSLCTLGMNENTPFGGFKAWYEKQDQVKQMHLDAEKALKKLKNFSTEYELRTIMQKYQSLLDNAAEEITVLTELKKKPTPFDYKSLANNFSL
jgi:HK97 family phage prohead protease